MIDLIALPALLLNQVLPCIASSSLPWIASFLEVLVDAVEMEMTAFVAGILVVPLDELLLDPSTRNLDGFSIQDCMC